MHSFYRDPARRPMVMSSGAVACLAILLRCSSARLPCSSGNRGPEMVFGDTEERLSQFGDKWQILNAIREHYLMKREADHGSQLFWDRIFQLWACRVSPLQGSCCQAVKMAEGSGEPCAAAVCAPGALHRHLRSLRTRALVALSWPGPNLPISAQSRRCLPACAEVRD